MEYIFVSPMIEASQGQLPCRVVGYKRTNHPFTNRPYVTHMEVFTEVDNDWNETHFYRHDGHYDLTFDEAIDDAMGRWKRESRHVK